MNHHRHVAQPNPWGLNREQLVLGAGTLTLVLFVLLIQLPWLSIFKRVVRLFRRAPKNAIAIGSERIPDLARLRHTHIVGATGTGKTVLLEELLFADLKRGYGAMVIDPKGERSFYNSVKSYCREINRENELILLSATNPNESAIWNPCALGSASELQSKFFNSGIYNEPHYAKACEYALGVAFVDLAQEKQGSVVTLEDLLRKLEKLSKEERNDVFQGLYFDLHNLLTSEWKELLVPSGEEKLVSILDVIAKNKILFVDLPTEGKRVQSSRLGRLLTQEIILISGMRKRNPALKGDRPFSVYIDEFDAFATESFSTFLNKGRSSEFMIHLAHQTLSDLNQIGPDFAGQVLGNCNVRFIFRQDDPDDAERWSRFIGTRKTIKSTFRTHDGTRTGDVSNRETQEFIVPPDTIKSLPIGRCVFSMKTEGVCEILRVPFKRKKPFSPSEESTPLLAQASQARPERAVVSESLGVKRCRRLERSIVFTEWP